MRKALFVATAALALWLAPGALAAGWCGTGEAPNERPDAQTGPQIHAVVMQPADVSDNFVADAGRLADDVTSMTTWWAGQDATRAPRFDLAVFPGGTCLDISYVRLPLPSSSYQGANVAFNAVYSQLQGGSGFTSAYKDYLVYYDGPSVESGVCGTGAGDFDQSGLAVVWLGGCPSVPVDGVAAHELLHAFGALPAGAPNFCTAATDPVHVVDTGHPCDSATDLLYPYADNSPLALKVLDFNHDDYYGHSGSWPDMQDSFFLHHTDAPVVPLAITVSGGTGEITSDLPGVDCFASCTTQWDAPTQVTLAETPTGTSRFIRWTGACVGAGSCVVNLTQPAALTVVFGPVTIPLKISVVGKGGVRCVPNCSKKFSAGDALSLRAVAATGWKFAGWSGGCKGTRVTCVPNTDYALTVRAAFKKLPLKKKR